VSIVPFDRDLPSATAALTSTGTSTGTSSGTPEVDPSVSPSSPELLHQLRGYPLGIKRRLAYPTYPAWGLLEQAAAMVPQRIATHMLGHELNYAQAHSYATRLASWLQQTGLSSGERVAVLLPNMPEYLIALNGVWRAGGVVVALSPLSVPHEIAVQMEATDCRRVICLDLLSGLLRDVRQPHQSLWVSLRPYLPMWKQVGYSLALWKRNRKLPVVFQSRRSRRRASGDRIGFWDAVGQGVETVIPVETLPGQDPAYILSTGGTTGDPKAVTLSHRNIVANAWQQAHWAGATMGEETLLACLPFFHSYGMSTMLAGGAALGATLILQPRFDVQQAVQAIERNRPTVFHAVPAMLNAMNKRLRVQRANLSSLKWVISGGAPLSPAVAEEFAQHSGAIVVQGYGLSEASPVTHVGPLNGTNLPGTIGLPLPDTDCRIVDTETGKYDVPVGEVGELIIRGPQVMLGYWNNPAATSQSVRDGWLHTGDLASISDSGFYRIVDRKKDLIITSGFNVYPADVEEVLRSHETVADVAVIGVPDSERGEIVKAYVVVRDGHSWQPSNLAKYCKQHLAAHRRPRLWERVEGDLPRNFLGKVVRRQLRKPNERLA
jgi:long-chain acyl-CoA synthetase